MLQQIGSMVLFLAAFGFTASAQAVLHDRGNGMIYDDVLNVTWLQDANYARSSGYHLTGNMSWQQGITWAEQLVYSGFDDWRLPKVGPVNGLSLNLKETYDGSSDLGYNIISPVSELSYMFYVNLGNAGEYDANGELRGCSGSGRCPENRGQFKNIGRANFRIWSSDLNSTFAFIFSPPLGLQTLYGKQYGGQAWAVRDGDIAPIPIPASAWLFVSGLGLLGLTRKLKV